MKSPILAGSLLGAFAVFALSAPAGATVLTDRDNQSWNATPANLTASANANLTVGPDNVDTHGAASATWASANSGSVQFTGYGWDFNVPSSPISGSNLTDARGGANLGASDWSYTFTATQDGQFTIDYSVTPNGNPFGLWGWQINCNCSNAGGPSLDAYDPTATGTFVGDIYAGGTYTVTLDGNPNVEFPFQAGNYSGSMDGLFSWSTTGDVAPIAGQLNVVANSSIGPAAPGVPEPAAWALMIGGFGLAGVALRRRRIVIA